MAAIHHIDSAFYEEGAQLTDDVVMTRGEDMPQDILEALKKQLEKGAPTRYQKMRFISTSASALPAFQHKKVMLEMTVRKGTPALSLAPLSSHNENEVLLRHGQAFEIYEIGTVMVQGEEKPFIRMITM